MESNNPNLNSSAQGPNAVIELMQIVRRDLEVVQGHDYESVQYHPGFPQNMQSNGHVPKSVLHPMSMMPNSGSSSSSSLSPSSSSNTTASATPQPAIFFQTPQMQALGNQQYVSYTTQAPPPIFVPQEQPPHQATIFVDNTHYRSANPDVISPLDINPQEQHDAARPYLPMCEFSSSNESSPVTAPPPQPAADSPNTVPRSPRSPICVSEVRTSFKGDYGRVRLEPFDLAGTIGMDPKMIHHLIRPQFAPRRNGRLFVTGTSDEGNFKDENSVIIAELTADCSGIAKAESLFDSSFPFESVVGLDYHGNYRLRTEPVNDQCRSFAWLNESQVCVAIGSSINVWGIDHNSLGVSSRMMVPDIHTDTIRELCVSHHRSNLLASGGHDKQLLVTDLTNFVVDSLSSSLSSTKSTTEQNHKQSDCYSIGEVVSSVRWHPTLPDVVSYTTDEGSFVVVDRRAKAEQSDQDSSFALNLKTDKPYLFCHNYFDENTVMLGYGNRGYVRMLDIRAPKEFYPFSTMMQSQIGEMVVDSTGRRFLMCGNPIVTTWEKHGTVFEMNQAVHFANQEYEKYVNENHFTCGTFVPDSNTVLFVDSLGYIGLHPFPCLSST